MTDHERISEILESHGRWLCDDEFGERADLAGANLARVSLCGATIDGAILSDHDLGGPGHILCALTDDEWARVQEGRLS